MKINFYSKIFIIFIIFIKCTYSLAVIKNDIIVKVGNEIITSVDVENEIRTILLLSGKTLTQENINYTKNEAIKSLMRKKIKKAEIEKYKVEIFDRNKLNDYLLRVSKQFNLPLFSLKKFLNENDVNYNAFKESFVIELKWMNLIRSIYVTETNINVIDLENELQNSMAVKKEIREYNLSEIQINSSKDNQNKLSEINLFIKKNGFENAATKFSNSTTASNKGNIGWITEKTLSPIYLNALKNLKKGNLTEPIKLPDSFVILKINDLKIIKNDDVDIQVLEKRMKNKQKFEKLQLYSRSHFSNLESSVVIEYK